MCTSLRAFARTPNPKPEVSAHAPSLKAGTVGTWQQEQAFCLLAAIELIDYDSNCPAWAAEGLCAACPTLESTCQAGLIVSFGLLSTTMAVCIMEV